MSKSGQLGISVPGVAYLTYWMNDFGICFFFFSPFRFPARRSLCKCCPMAALLFLFQQNNAPCLKSLGRETKYVSTSQMASSAELQMDLSLPAVLLFTGSVLESWNHPWINKCWCFCTDGTWNCTPTHLILCVFGLRNTTFLTGTNHWFLFSTMLFIKASCSSLQPSTRVEKDLLGSKKVHVLLIFYIWAGASS